MSAPANPPPTKLAATILMLREGAQGMEVFMVVRHQQIDFASGAIVFPGGKLAAGDSDPRVRTRATGLDGLSDEQCALRVGAIREAFEECGLLLARARGENTLLGAARVAELGTRYRQPLDRGELGMADLLEREDLVLACEELVPYAHWITPVFMPKRFDTWFYLARAPQDQAALHDGREAVDSVWIRPADAIAQAAAGTRTIVPATLVNVQKLGFSTTVDAALHAARTQPVVSVLPVLEQRADGTVLKIPMEAGYRTNEMPMPRDLR